MKTHKILYISVILNTLLFCIIGVFVFLFFFPLHKTDWDDIREKSNYTFVNPLLECNDSWYRFYNSSPLENTLEEYIEEQIQNEKINAISYYVRLLRNGSTFGYDQTTEFAPASLIKIPLAIALFKNIEKSDLETRYKISYEIIGVERNFWHDILVTGQEYSLREIIEAMLVYSDNIAVAAVIQILGEDKIYQVYDQLWLQKIDLDDVLSVNITAKDYSTFFRVLYNASFISRDDSEYILSLLSQSDFKEGIRSTIPWNILVANKFWEKAGIEDEKQLHDCGIVYYPNNPYIVCIMTKGTDFNSQLWIIQHISEQIFKNMK